MYVEISSYQVIERALEAYSVMPRVEWVVKWPGQAVLCVSQKYWTAYVHEAIRNGQKVTDPCIRSTIHAHVHIHVHIYALLLHTCPNLFIRLRC